MLIYLLPLYIIPAFFFHFFFQFILTSASIPLPLPIGLYATNLIIGLSFGRLVGEILYSLDFAVEPASIAMIGGAAYVGAVTHTFSSGVLLLELTG